MDNSKQRLIAIAAVVIVILLGINAFLLVSRAKQQAQNTELNTQLNEAEQLKVELQKEYYEAMAELEEMKGSNEELNALIEEQQSELQDQKNNIDRLLRDNRQLDKARREIKGLAAKMEEYTQQIALLEGENADLKDKTRVLSQRSDSLSTTLQARTMEAEELSTAKAALTSENEALQSERAQLSQKVDVASVIKTGGIEVTGFKTRSNGKAVEKKSAKNIDHLKICFSTTENRVADYGSEIFYIRLINPVGETMAIDELGSGIVTDRDSGEQLRYTKTAEIDYDRSANTLCTNWKPNTPFQKGTYEIQVYNKGYVAGQDSFTLK